MSASYGKANRSSQTVGQVLADNLLNSLRTAQCTTTRSPPPEKKREVVKMYAVFMLLRLLHDIILAAGQFANEQISLNPAIQERLL